MPSLEPAEEVEQDATDDNEVVDDERQTDGVALAQAKVEAVLPRDGEAEVGLPRRQGRRRKARQKLVKSVSARAVEATARGTCEPRRYSHGMATAHQ